MSANRSVAFKKSIFYKSFKQCFNANFLKKSTNIAKKTALKTVNGTVRAILTSKAKRTILCMK